MNAIQRNLITGMISMYGKDNIGKLVNQVVAAVLEKKRDIPLSEGESDISAHIFEVNGEIYYSTVGTREGDNQEIIITRFIHVQKISNFIETILKQLD